MKDFRMLPGDYRHECDPTRALDEFPARSDREYMQHVVVSRGARCAHVHRRDSEGVVRCSWRNCILNKGRVWAKKKRKKKT